jgi:hypothetical protein
MRKQKEIRCGEFSNYVKGWACGWEKEISFREPLAIAGKRRRHVSYANQTALHRRPPFHPSAFFLLPPISLSIAACVKEKET